MSEFLSAIIGAIIGFIASFLTLKFNYKQLFAETVSHSRMKWIDDFREEFSIIIGTARNCKNYRPKEETILKAEQARVKLLTRLNQDTNKYGNEYNEIFSERLEKLSFYNTSKKELKELLDISRKILEHEWKKVKKEAKGEKQNV